MNDESTAGFSSEDSVVETSMTSTIHPSNKAIMLFYRYMLPCFTAEAYS